MWAKTVPVSLLTMSAHTTLNACYYHAILHPRDKDEGVWALYWVAEVMCQWLIP